MTRARPDQGIQAASQGLDYTPLIENGSFCIGDPDRCIEIAKRYEAAGCDLLFCLLNPYDMKHDDVMHSIELIGKHLIPEFSR